MLFANGPPAAIAVIGFSLDSAAILVSLAALNPSPLPKLYGVDGNATPVFVADAPPSVVIGMRGTGSAPVRPQTAVYADYAATYRRVVGQEPVLGAEALYDGIYMTALALLQGRENTTQAVYGHLREISRPDSPNAIPIPAGPAGFQTALQNIGADFDYMGTRGAMNYDEARRPDERDLRPVGGGARADGTRDRGAWPGHRSLRSSGSGAPGQGAN